MIGIVTRPIKAMWTAFLKSQSDVEQDYKMLLMVDYKGYAVQLVPVMDPDRPGWVKTWIPDPAEVDKIDKGGHGIPSCEMHITDATAVQPAKAPVLPTAGAQPGFNPAAASGL